MPNVSKTPWWNLLLFYIWWDICWINSYIESDVDWSFPWLIDYWLITNTSLHFGGFWAIFQKMSDKFCLYFDKTCIFGLYMYCIKVMVIEISLHWSKTNQSIGKMAKSVYAFILRTVHRRVKRMKIWTPWTTLWA